MSTVFDQLATIYDAEFTDTPIGRLQRKMVWRHLAKSLKDKQNLDILELNCGTGEDAILLASAGHQVLATDLSPKMIEQAKNKMNSEGIMHNLKFAILDISDPETYPKNNSFDLIFSNFGGLNCIEPKSLKDTFSAVSTLLKPTGRLIFVIMPKYCLWDSLYMFFTGSFSRVFRRNQKEGIDVPIDKNNVVKTWYYSPGEIKKLSNGIYRKIKVRPAGLFLPPSYMNPFFNDHLKLLNILNYLEKAFSGFSIFSDLSDHFFIEMEVK